MKIKEILKTAAGIAGTLYPPLGAVIGVVNAALPPEKRLPATATGAEVEKAIEALPPEAQVHIKEQEIALEIAREEGWTERYRAMVEADTHSTRPRIALIMAWLLTIETIALTAAVGYQVASTGAADAQLWTLFGILTAPPLSLLAKYFGELRREQGQRQAAISGRPELAAGAIGHLVNAIRGGAR